MFCCLFYFWFNWRYFYSVGCDPSPLKNYAVSFATRLFSELFTKSASWGLSHYPNWFQIYLFIINFNFDCKLWKDYFKRCLIYSYSYYYVWRFDNGYFIVISPLYQVWLWQRLLYCNFTVVPNLAYFDSGYFTYLTSLY